MVVPAPAVKRGRRPHHHGVVLGLALGMLGLLQAYRGSIQGRHETHASIGSAESALPKITAESVSVASAASSPLPVETTDLIAAPTIAEPPPASLPSDDSPAEPEEPVDEPRQRLLGAWVDEFYGRRVFEFRDDGTATMTLELDAVGKLLYGPKLTFFIDWTLEADVLTLKMTGGEPAGTAVSLAKLFGESSQQRLEGVTDAELQLRSLDSDKLYLHRRLLP
jgi:hypothetical protein